MYKLNRQRHLRTLRLHIQYEFDLWLTHNSLLLMESYYGHFSKSTYYFAIYLWVYFTFSVGETNSHLQTKSQWV